MSSYIDRGRAILRDPSVSRVLEGIYYTKAHGQAEIPGNIQKGEEAFRAGQTGQFPGYKLSASERLVNIGLLYSAASMREVVKRVSVPTQEIADKHGVPVLVAGLYPNADLDPHTTLDLAVFKDIDDKEILLFQDRLAQTEVPSLPNFPSKHQLNKDLIGRIFHMPRLIVGPAGYIDSPYDTDQEVAFRARIAARALMTATLINTLAPDLREDQRVEWLKDNRHKFGPPYSYSDIFHTSVFRVNGVVEPRRLLAFKEELTQKVGTNIAKDPIQLVVSELFVGSAADFQRRLGVKFTSEN